MKKVLFLSLIIIASCNYKNTQDALSGKFDFADRYIKEGNMEAYKVAVLKTEQEAYKSKDSASIAKANFYLGEYYIRQSVNDSAFSCYSTSEKIFTKLGDYRNAGISFFNMAYIYYENGDFSRSEILSFKAISCFRRLVNVDKELYKVYNLLGNICNERKEYDKAIEFHYKALEFVKKELVILFEPHSLNNLGVVYRNIDRNEDAINCFEKALKNKNLKKESPILYAMLLDNLAYSKLKLKKYSKLPDLFYQALSIRDSLQIVSGIVINKLHLSEYYQDQKNNNNTVLFAKEAYTIAKEKGIDPADILHCLKHLINVDKANNIAYLHEYVFISDSLKNKEPKLANKISQAEFDKSELSFKNEKLEKDNRNIITASIIIILTLIIAFLIRYLRIKKKIISAKEFQLRSKDYFQNTSKGMYQMLLFQSDKSKTENEAIMAEMHLQLLEKLEKVRHKLNSTVDLVNVDFYDEIKSVEDIIAEISKYVMKENKNSFIIILQNLIKEYSLNIKFDMPKYKWQDVNATIKITLYKVIKEALDNIVKHAKAKKVSAIISVANNILNLEISDNGIGFDADGVRENSGLKEVRFYVNEIDGLFFIDSKKDKGTKIKVEIKL